MTEYNSFTNNIIYDKILPEGKNKRDFVKRYMLKKGYGDFMEICVFGASSSIIDKSYINEVENMGREIAKRGHGMVYGAGASGLMGAAARGVHENGGHIVGVVPDFFESEDMGVDGRIFKQCDELIKTDSMRERKRIMEERGDAFVIVPGGIGTFEEFFEVLTLKQLDRHNKAIAILNIEGYYDAMLKMLDIAIEKKFFREACRLLYKVFDDYNEMLDYIESYEAPQVNVFDFKNIEKG